MAYDKNKDYTTAIKEASERGDTAAVQQLNKERNEKIADSNGSLDKYKNDVDKYVSTVTIGKDSNGNTTVTKTSKPSGGSSNSNNITADALGYSADELDANGVPSWLGSSGAYEALTPEAVEAINSGKQLRYNSNNGTYLSDEDYNKLIESAGPRPVDYRDAALYDAALQKKIADASYNSNSYYKSGDILDDVNLSQNDRMKILNSKQAYEDAKAVGDIEGMSRANQIVNDIKASYGYAPSYANNDINATLLANGGQLVEARDVNGALIDGGVYTINGKAYDPKTGQAVTNGSLVYNSDGTKSWIKNSFQANGTPYENYNPITSNNALANLLGLEDGTLDNPSAQTVAKELGYSNLYELQQMFREQADTLKALAQTQLDNYSKDFMAAALMASEDTKSEMMMNLANEALSGGSSGAAAANLIQTIMGANSKYNEITDNYQQQVKELQAQYNADIAAGDVNAYNKYVEQINKAKEIAQTDYYNNLMLANIAAAVYQANITADTMKNTYSGSNGGSSGNNDVKSVIKPGDKNYDQNVEALIEEANRLLYNDTTGLLQSFGIEGKFQLTDVGKQLVKNAIDNSLIVVKDPSVGLTNTDIYNYVLDNYKTPAWKAAGATTSESFGSNAVNAYNAVKDAQLGTKIYDLGKSLSQKSYDLGKTLSQKLNIPGAVNATKSALNNLLNK